MKYKYQPKFHQQPPSSQLPKNRATGLLIPVSLATFGLGIAYYYKTKWTSASKVQTEPNPNQLKKAELSPYQKAVQPSYTSLLSSTTPSISISEDLSTKFDELAPKYDSEIGMDETVMGLNVLRRYLIKQHAKGDVIEFSLGTGRNMSFYNQGAFNLFFPSNEITSFTGIEKSAPMLDQTLTQSGTKELFRNFILSKKPIHLYQMDAHDASELPSKHYDTVVDTFGLCSYTDPVKVLGEMKRLCKDDGKILLLQHGRGTFQWLNGHLDKHADHHAHKWGCWWNRDILNLVKEAGLDVEYSSRWHFGTTYYIIARPKPTV